MAGISTVGLSGAELQQLACWLMCWLQSDYSPTISSCLVLDNFFVVIDSSALTLFVGHQEKHLVRKLVIWSSGGCVSVAKCE